MNSVWLDNFIKTLYKKYPQRVQLVENLADLLSIERESVYRRLRKDVVFSAEELMKIASAWNISLDGVYNIDSKYLDFKLIFIDFLNPSDEELKYLKGIINRADEFKNNQNMEYIEISNKLPRGLISKFPYVDRFQLLKWTHLYTGNEILPFSKVSFLPKISTILSEYSATARSLKNTTYIWSPVIIEEIIRDIRYFHSVYLITDEEKELIKNDISMLLEYMSELADKGAWPETSNKVNLYISNVSIDTNYSFYFSDEYKIFRVHVFAKNEVYTNNPIVVSRFESWVQYIKSSSTLISQANLKSKIDFFNKQRELLETL